ncbi:lasso peptide biosynthesis PqqD family chaperone [Nocardia panacis]|uniref:Lasso peptide biosynthesis PqqD family chaperone n=1 Tax=Nocardia panacis TaxID=2340916 RepID=A0A3A4KFZ5_9NOCA|nr:lasso peptide biosynthesis PqqD family chaperone [Nocardia panacis]RJO78079.1 lasso peptide biosynthesis PqqD family chaperone [Nocardia panacis]
MSYRLNPRVCATDTDTGMVLLDKRSGRYFELNAAGRLVLRILLDGRGPRQAAQALVAGTSVPAADADRDVVAFLDTLRSRGLVIQP